MSVKSLDFVMKTNLNDKEKTTYSCNGFSVLEDCSTKKNKECIKDLGTCRRSNGNNGSIRDTRKPIISTKDQKISKMVVTMGSDGTKDDVKMKICSEDNTVCCVSDKLSNLLSREWVENKVETWEASKFGKCKNQVFKVFLSNLCLLSSKKNRDIMFKNVFHISCSK